MTRKHITLVALMVVATALTGAGLVSAGHDPVDPDDVYIHKIGSITQGPGASICVQDMSGPLNKVTVEGRTTHTDTVIYHDGADGDVVLNIPELTTIPGHKIIVYTNDENSVIANADAEGGGESCPVSGSTTVDGPIILGVYYLVTGQIELTRTFNVTTGPNRADDAPEPGSGSFGLGASDPTSVGTSDSPSAGDDIDTVASEDVGATQPLYGSQSNLPDDGSDASDGPGDDTTDDAESVVGQVQQAVQDAIDSVVGDGSSADDATNTSTNTTNTTDTTDTTSATTGADGGNVGAGALGLTGFLGLLGVLFAAIRDRSH